MSAIRLAAAALLFVPLLAGAAGLGRLTVLSALGQPLEAEIEIVSLQPGEEEGLSARLAAPDAFRQAGIELSPVLLGAQFSIERRAGRPVVRMRTTQPVNEPFVDVLVELQWSAGRLVREYTFLLDPPEYKGSAPIAAAPPAPAAKPAPSPAPAPADAERPRVEARPIPPKPAPRPASAATHEVKKGDTLAAIARRNLHEGVTLNQMLIALFRANRDAFIRDNINLVRAGRILNIPDRQAAVSVDPSEATRLVQSQMAQFAEYRRTLAGAVATAPATAAPAPREATGRIAPKPEAAAAGESKDQLRLSRVDPAKPGAPGTRAAMEDDRIARERALKEAQSRISELERNVADLQKLLELKNRQLAALEKKAASAPEPEPAKPAPEKAKAAPEAAKAPVEPPKPAQAVQPPAEPTRATEPAKAPEPAKAAEPVKAPEAPKAPAKPAAEAKKPKPEPAKAPAPEPDLIDEVLGFVSDPVSGGGLALVIVLLVVYGGWQWRRKKAAQARFQDSVLGAASGAGTSSVLGAAAQPAAATAAVAAGAAAAAVAAGQAVAAEQPAPAPAEPEELDPIAEADVYMAYGRNAQAEEILKEALAKDPERLAVHAKLLEVYANQKNTQAFEQTALKVKSLTGASGPEWDKAVALGHSLDPGNPLYASGAQTAASAEAVAPAAAAPALDFDLGGAAAEAAPEGARTDVTAPLDFDLGAGAPQGASAGGSQDTTGPLDFDLGAGAPAAAGAPQETTAPLDFDLGAAPEKSDFAPGGTLVLDTGEAKAAAGGLDFDLDKTIVATPTPPASKPPVDADATVAMDFDLNLDLGQAKPEEKPAAGEAPVDLGAISLDLGEPSAPSGGGEEKWRSMSEKLELSKAFLDIGQKDEARELLNEVVKEGDAAQQAQARQMLASLG